MDIVYRMEFAFKHLWRIVLFALTQAHANNVILKEIIVIKKVHLPAFNI